VLGTAAAGMALLDARETRQRAIALTGGDPERGRGLLTRYGCAGCHTIPGVARADGIVGPPLAGIADRVYLGGVLTNTPEHLIAWIVDPRAIDDKTAMPVTGIGREEARDVAAYLYTLR
jgi:cytochrome c2